MIVVVIMMIGDDGGWRWWPPMAKRGGGAGGNISIDRRREKGLGMSLVVVTVVAGGEGHARTIRSLS